MGIRKRRKDGSASPPLESIAGNGLLDRRTLLGGGIVLAGAASTGVGTSVTSAAAARPMPCAITKSEAMKKQLSRPRVM